MEGWGGYCEGKDNFKKECGESTIPLHICDRVRKGEGIHNIK